jgi:predicted MFS family arabinose efflux permease
MLHNGSMSLPAIPLFKSIWLAAFSSMCSMRICDAMLPALARDFNTSMAAVAGTISGFAIAYGFMQLIYGPLADHFGKPRVIAWVSVGCVFGLGLASVAPTLFTLISARALTGMTAAGIIPIAMAYIGDNSSSENRQATLANFISATILGSMAGQLVGGLASDTVGWRWAFALICMLFVLTAWNLRHSLSARDAAIRALPKVPFSDSIANGLKKYRQVFQTQGMPLFLALTFFQGAVNFAGMSFVPSFVHEHFVVSLTKASVVVVGYALGGLVYSRTANYLLTRFTVPHIAFGGGLLQALSFASLVLVPTWFAALIVGLVGGYGSIMLHNSLQTQATRMVPTSTGTSVASFAMILFAGQAIGVSTIAALMAWFDPKLVMFVLTISSVLLASAVFFRFKYFAQP